MTMFALKVIAVVTMIVDHVATIIIMANPHLVEANPIVFNYMRYVGTISFPIFAYLIANGCVHTKNIYKYLVRLGILAIISEVPYDLAFWGHGGGISFLNNTNIFYTLFLGVGAVAVYEWLRDVTRNIPVVNLVVPVLAVVPFFASSQILGSDFSGVGVPLIFFLYVFDPMKKPFRIVIMTVNLLFYYGRHFIPAIAMSAPPAMFQHVALALGFSLISVVLVAFYNQKIGVNSPWVKWGFYAFYPLHIALFAGIARII